MPIEDRLQDKVVQHVFKSIQLLKLNPGDMISEVALADELDMSRTPVREALIRLSSDGVLEKVPRKGYRLVAVDRKRIDDTHEAIALLDARSAALALPYIGEDCIRKMYETVDKIDISIKYRNFEDYYALQMAFHEIYRVKCPNAVIIETLNQLIRGTVRQTYYSESTEALFSALSETERQHREMIELFKSGDSDRLERYIRDVHWHTMYPDLI